MTKCTSYILHFTSYTNSCTLGESPDLITREGGTVTIKAAAPSALYPTPRPAWIVDVPSSLAWLKTRPQAPLCCNGSLF